MGSLNFNPLLEMVFSLPKRHQIYVNLVNHLRVVVALHHTEFLRQVAVSMDQYLATALFLRQGIATIPLDSLRCRSPAACRI
jgi:hypothetical protein